MDISVIIPVYNVEPVFERCVRSLFNQTKTDNVEFIFINDCTPDDSMGVLDRVIQEYPNLLIRIYNNSKNMGISYNRQFGVNMAIGEYSIQIDSDDWCEPSMLEYLYTKAKNTNADIVVCDIYSGGRLFSHSCLNGNLNPIACSHFVMNSKISCSLWSILVSHDLYKSNNISVPDNMCFGEDSVLVVQLYMSAKKISYVPKAFYHREHDLPISLSRSNNYHKTISFSKVYVEIEKFADSNGLLDIYRCNKLL